MASSAMLATTAAVTETSAAAEEIAATTKTTVVTATSAASLLEEGDDECKDDDVLNRSLRSCANDPDFAVICAFLQKFAKELGLELPNFKRLQEWLTNTDEVAAQIRDLHIKLMRKTRKTVHEKSWESALSKFCFTYSAQDGWEVERFGYKQASLKVKLRILRELLESQFERNGKFRNKILTLSADSLRSQPIGRDRLGHSYWLTQDADCNLRIYQEHLDEEIWQVVATNRDEFVNLIARLRGNEVVLPATDIGVIDEDTSSSNSCLAPIEKPPPPEEKDDSQEEEIKVPNLRIKMSSDGSYQSGKDLGKGEEELAAEEDKKLEQRKLKTVAGVVEQDDGSDDDGDEDEEEEEESEEEEEEDSGEEEQSEDEVTSISKIAEKNKIVAPAVEVQKKPIVISNAKIVSSASAPHPTSTNSAAKKRFLDEVDKTSPRSDDIINSIKKFRPSLLDSKREKKPSKYGKAKSEDEDDEDDDESEESEEDDEADIDDVEDECEEEDIDSAAAEEDENEEKDIEDDDYDDLEVGEAIEDPPIRVFGEGSGKQCDGANPEFSSEFLLIEENCFLLSQDEDSEPEVGEAIEEEYLYICGEGHGAECLVGNKNSGEEPTTPTTTKRMNEPKATFFFGEPGCLKLSPIKKSSTSTDVDALSNDEENAVQDKAESSANCIEVEQIEEPLKEETILLKNADNDSKNSGNNDKEQNVKISTKIVKEKKERNCEENNEKNNQPNEKKYEENVKENDREEKKLDLEQVLKADSQNTPENASNDIVKNKNGENNVEKENLTIHHIQELVSNNLNVEKVAEGQLKEKTNENIAFNGGEINKTTNEIQERQNIDHDHSNKSTEMEVEEESKQEFENQSEKKSYNQAEKLRHIADDNLQKPTSSKMLQNPIEFAIKPDEKAVERFSQKLEQISKEKSSIPLKVSLENNAFLKVQENPALNINEIKNESIPEIKKEQEISLKTQKIQETQIIDLKNEKKTITSNVRTKEEEKEFSVKCISENISLKNVNDESENKITPKVQEKCEKTSFDVKKVALKLAGGNLKNSASHNVEEVKDVKKSSTDVEEKSEPCSSKMLGITLKKNLFAYSENLSINADGESEQKLAPYIEKNSNNKSPSSENKSSNISLTKQHNNVKTTDSDMVEKVQNVDAAVCRQLSPPNSQTRKESSVLELQQASRDNISFNRSSPLKLLIKEPQKVSTTSSLPNRKRRLAEFEAAERTNTCQLTTSDSELDFHIDKTLEPPQVAADDIGYDVGNVGGKRLKMRGKLTNSEIRKKVEAQKIAAVEETTSSSGEEEALRKRKIISPKRQLLDHKSQKMEVQKKSDFSVKTDVPEVKEVAAKLGPSLLKQKPTLAEIVEKTLKKTAEKSEAHLVVSACTSQEATGNLRNSKTSSVIKPLKKNLLIQLRQEESDEETIPRKRTISETVHHSVERASTKLVTIAPKKEEEEITRTRPDRTTPDRQRKRRSSEEIKQIVLTDHKNPQTSECVGEKLKKNDANISKEMSENEKLSKDFPSVVKSLEMTEEGEQSLQNKQPKSLHPKSLDANPVLPIVETIKPVIKEELLKTIVEDITPVIKDEITTPTTVGRRSGRRGGATVIYAELPQPKRTRGGISKATASITKSKKEDTPEKMDESQTKPKQEAMEIKKSLAYPELSKLTSSAKESLTKSDTPKSITSSAAMEDQQTTSTPLEAEITKPATLKEKSNLITSEEDDEQKPSTPLKASSSVTKTASPKSTPNARGRGRKNKEVDTTNILELVDSETPVRQSRRIAQQKIREEAERRKLEEIALRTMKNELKKKKKAEAQADPTVPEPSEHSSSSNESDASEVEAEEAKKSKKKKCPGKDGTWSSGSEEQEEPEEEEEPPHYETDPGSPLFRSDHEFSPESDLEDESQVVPMKRARTARKEDGGDVPHQDQEEEACQKCGKSDHPEWILLCDSCDKGYHCSCLLPVLFYIPEGDWHCPPCQQEQLIAALEKQLQDFDDLVEQKRLEQEQAQRLAQEAERVEKQRQEEEKRKKKKKKQREDDESSENEDDEKSNAAKVGTKESGDDDDDKTLKKDKKSKKNQSIEKRKQRHETGGTRRRRRKAATRGARRRRRNETGGSADSDGSSGSGSRSGSDSGSGSSSSSSSSSSASDSEDEPIYKLRKRRQINVSYRLNEYDDLINSALKKEMDEAAGAGNLGRGKDITTIIEADKEEQARHTNVEDDEVIKPDNHAVKKETEEMTEKQPEIVKTENADENEKKNAKEDVDSEEEPLQRKANTKTLKKKPRKLTTLDISSEEDNASDEDFKGSSLDDDDEDTSVSVSSNSDSSLEIYRRRNKKGKKKTRKVARRAARERRKVKKFVVDDSDDDEEEVSRPKTKKKRKTDSDYTESEEDDENSELSENVDSADLCDDSTSSEGSDGAWCPSKRKKKRKANVPIARKSPKLKKPQIKKPKRVEYSDDDISEEEEEDYDDDDDDLATGGKGSGKQPRTVPLKKSNSGKGKGKGKGGAGAGKSSKAGTASKKKKRNLSDYDDESLSESDDSTRKTRGRRYAYLEDFEDDSSDGGIKPGVQRPDTPPEEREKFIKKQEEIKRMLAEKNAEGAKLAATPRLTPIKGGTRSPAKPGDSLSTVPLSVIRQAKVLDIDYLQRKGESVSDVDNVDDVDSEFDDADLPDDFPEDMDEDAIARMVEEEEEFGAANASRELPAPDEVLKPSAAKAKPRESEKPVTNQAPNPSLVAMSHIPTTATVGPSASASGLQEPLRKRLPMPTMHPPLLRHQYPGGGHHQIPPHMMQRHAGPPTHLLQNALSAPLGQPIHRHFPHQAPGTQRGPPGGGMPPRHALPPHTLPPPQQQLAASHPLHGAAGSAAASEPKPRGRRKKITPLRDPLQKQQAAAAATAAAAVQAATTVSGNGKTESSSTTAVATGVIKNASSLTIAQPPQLYKPPGGGGASAGQVQPSVITRMPHLPQHSGPPGRGMPHGPPGLYAGGDARFYGSPMQQPGVGVHGSRLSPAGSQRHRGPPHGSGMTHHSMRPSYGPPPPLRGVVGPPNQPSSVSGTRAAYHPPPNHGDHRGPQPTGPYGPPPPARHAAPHMNPYRPSIFGNPNYAPRGAQPGSNLRNAGPPGQDYTAGPPRSYAPYGYYPPPPPLTAAHPPASSAPHPPAPTTHAPNISTSQPSTTHAPSSTTTLPSAVPSSVIVSAPPSSHSLTSVATSAAAALQKHATPRVIPKSAPNAPTQTTSGGDKSSPSASSASAKAHLAAVVVEPRKKLITLETFATSKSPLAISGESSGSRSSPNVQPDGADDSTSRPAAATSAGDGQGASEFSGLVSYFSSQHDDYNT